MSAQAPTLSPGRFKKLLTTRRGTLALAGLCAAVAGVAMMVFLAKYRDSVSAAAVPAPVLVATSLIEKGTPGDAIAEKHQFETVTRATDDLKQGAVADPAALEGKVAASDIYPGQQLTAADFKASTGTVLPKLSGKERAISVPVDASHGLVGQVQSGDRIDVLASYTSSSSATGQGQGVVKTILQDKLVLRAGAQPMEGANEGKAIDKSVVVRVTDREAVAVAHAADNGKIWVLLRPGGDADESDPRTVTMDSVLRGAGSPPGFKATIRRRGDTVTVTGGPTP